MSFQNQKKESLVLILAKLQSEDIISDNLTEKELFEALVQYVEQLIQGDFNRLMSILYRIDVSEEKVRAALENNKEELSAGYIIASMLVEREIEKMKFRANYRSK